MRLQGLAPERPLTHDLFATTLGVLGAKVERVTIATLAEETFHARIVLTAGDRRLEIDSRPSDALALAVRLSVPIFAAADVLEQAGLGADEASEEESSDRPVEELERTGERAADPRLDIFRDFVNSLDVDAEGEQREGPGRP